MKIEEEEQLKDSYCECCESTIKNYCGYVTDNDEIISDYWLRIPEGHGGHYTLGIAIEKNNNPRAAVLIGEATPEGKTYWIQNLDNSPWDDFGEYGNIMNRNEVKQDPKISLIFQICDSIAAQDSRLIPHIEEHTNDA